MAKESFYFQHDYEPTSDPKIQALVGQHGAVGYGVYWRIVEMLHSTSEHTLPLKDYLYIAIARQMSLESTQVQQIITNCIGTFELFGCDGLNFWSERVFRNFEKRKETSQKRSLAGKASGESRRKKKEAKVIPIEQKRTSVQQN